MEGGIPAVLIYEDLEALTPYMHTANDVIGVSLNSPESLEGNARLAVAAIATLAGPWDEAEAAKFARGDASSDGTLNISDAILVLGYLFLGNPVSLGCQKAADLDDGGSLKLSDPVLLLNFLFRGGPPPEPPFPECGLDGTPDGLSCEAQAVCQ